MSHISTVNDKYLLMSSTQWETRDFCFENWHGCHQDNWETTQSFICTCNKFWRNFNFDSRSNDEPKAENEDMMHHHNHHQRFYQYAGPPSIVMGTWGDRSGRSHFAPPPPPFAIPPAGVPGGRLGPAPNSRMNTGYHSLQYTPNPPPEFRGNGLEKKNSSASTTKYSSSKKAAPAKAAPAVDHGSDQLHKLPQVIWSYDHHTFILVHTPHSWNATVRECKITFMNFYGFF